MKRLAIVADNSLMVEAIRLGLRHSGGFRILGYIDASQASAKIVVEARPEVVLVDDMQHSHQALQLIRDIRSQDEAIVLILLTMRMDPEWLNDAFEAGARTAISKAIHPVALGTLVRETANGNVVHMFTHGRREVLPVAEECPLTARELEILHHVSSGATNGEIARHLWVTEQTVKFHLSNVYRKLGVSNRTQASHYAHRTGLLDGQTALAS